MFTKIMCFLFLLTQERLKVSDFSYLYDAVNMDKASMAVYHLRGGFYTAPVYFISLNMISSSK